LTRRLGVFINPFPLCFQPWDVESLAENLFSNITHPFMIIFLKKFDVVSLASFPRGIKH
jgi:hypothetical protein